MHLLVNAASDDAEQSLDTTRAQAVITEAASDHVNWISVQWAINGHATSAQVRRIAQSWCGFALGGGTRGVAVAGNEVDSSNVALDDVHSADGYNVDFLATQNMSEVRQIALPSYVVPTQQLGELASVRTAIE